MISISTELSKQQFVIYVSCDYHSDFKLKSFSFYVFFFSGMQDNAGNHKDTLILQESCIDASGAMLVYTTVDCSTMQLVMSGGDSAYVALLPSGFVILPDGRSNNNPATGKPDDNTNFNINIDSNNNMPGSLVTVAFQILSQAQNGKFSSESVTTVRNLLTCTLQKIQSALAPVDNAP